MSGLTERKSEANSTTHLTGGLKSILIVEDDADAMEELSEILELEGWAALTARTVSDALQKIEETSVSVVVTDVHLGGSGAGESGIQLVSRAKAKFPERDLSFIVLSGDVDAVKFSLQTDAVDFLLKPVAADDLIAALNEAQRLSGTERHLSEFAEYLIKKTGKAPSGPDPSAANGITSKFSHERKKATAAEEKAFVLQYAIGADLVTTCFKPIVAFDGTHTVALEAAPLIKETSNGTELQNYFDLARGTKWAKTLDDRMRRDAVRALSAASCAEGFVGPLMVLFPAEQVTNTTDVRAFTKQLAEADVSGDQILLEVAYDTSLDLASAKLLKSKVSQFAGSVLRVDVQQFSMACAFMARMSDFGFGWVRLCTESVPDWDVSPERKAEIRALISVANAVGAKVVLDCVDTEDALNWARSEGCAAVQGKAVTNPVALENIGDFVAQPEVLS